MTGLCDHIPLALMPLSQRAESSRRPTRPGTAGRGPAHVASMRLHPAPATASRNRILTGSGCRLPIISPSLAQRFLFTPQGRGLAALPEVATATEHRSGCWPLREPALERQALATWKVGHSCLKARPPPSVEAEVSYREGRGTGQRRGLGSSLCAHEHSRPDKAGDGPGCVIPAPRHLPPWMTVSTSPGTGRPNGQRLYLLK